LVSRAATRDDWFFREDAKHKLKLEIENAYPMVCILDIQGDNSDVGNVVCASDEFGLASNELTSGQQCPQFAFIDSDGTVKSGIYGRDSGMNNDKQTATIQ